MPLTEDCDHSLCSLCRRLVGSGMLLLLSVFLDKFSFEVPPPRRAPLPSCRAAGPQGGLQAVRVAAESEGWGHCSCGGRDAGAARAAAARVHSCGLPDSSP